MEFILADQDRMELGMLSAAVSLDMIYPGMLKRRGD